ncbi:aminotransferase, class V superfamily protein [Acanthamoeba castellanii str. Neff]|uniref:alanine--glyoxylate transaminase n=1 Tax=Acanthamoeba castellanii (strain ATCC 30010 / Neff) TaxID=1257118 RepID=L8GNK4_ACACF|nr:aminotransferase, class V superfamily protein [Acanthamoeba castellanii str. Neff]ELR14399.1 aminotransferase, class V superfamily protein [Acanthamoeba castellanii str. Neff]
MATQPTSSSSSGGSATYGYYETYPVGMVPGPTSVPQHVRDAFAIDYASADLELPFFELYAHVQTRLAEFLRVPSSSASSSSLPYENDVIIQVGEGMLALWSALKSTIKAGDRVLAISNGVYGSGFAEMAKQIGADVRVVEFEYDQPLHDFGRIAEVARSFKPHLITAVQCETPSGMMNRIAPLGRIARDVDALLYVDFVSAAFGADVRVGEWDIDLGLLGSQKALSSTPSLSIVTVSPRAWRKIEAVAYVGYDALLPWRGALARRFFPYTFDWHSLAALGRALDAVAADGGLESQLARHSAVAAYCRRQEDDDDDGGVGFASTVTAIYVPLGRGGFESWAAFDGALRARGLVVGGSYGPLLEGKVFRLGHMGSQADMALVTRALDLLQSVISTSTPSSSSS